MESSVFESPTKKPKNKKLNVLIPLELEQHINDVINELKIKAPELKFNTNAICVDALSKAVKKAKRELETMKESTPATQSTTTTPTHQNGKNSTTT